MSAEQRGGVSGGQPEVALVYDGTYTGFLSVVFVAARERLRVVGIHRGAPTQMDFTREYRRVESDASSAARVQAAIEEKLSPLSPSRVELAFRCDCEPDIDLHLYRYLQHGWKVKRDLDDDLTHPDVWAVMSAAQRAGHEIHTLHGLLRFARAENGAYYARISPDNDILEPLTPHFLDRYADQAWVIHDVRRNRAALYPGRPGAPCTFYAVPEAAADIDPDLPDEGFQVLWGAFFRSIAVKERISARRQRKNMPRRYWEHMPEMRFQAPRNIWALRGNRETGKNEKR